jgi:hypothetical protein
MRRNEPTKKFENAVPAGLLFGPRFRLGCLPMSNSRLATCVAFRVARFPFDLDFGLALCTSLLNGAGEGVNAYWSDDDELEAKLGAEINEGARVWK